MKNFANLVSDLGTGNKVNRKVNLLHTYFMNATPEDSVCIIALFTGKRPKRSIKIAQLKEWCMEMTQIPAWLFNECYHTVGDLAETIALLLHNPDKISQSGESLHFYLNTLSQLHSKPDTDKKQFVQECWGRMSSLEIFVFNKLITGGFRVGVSQKILVNALSAYTNLPPATIMHQLAGKWEPATTTFDQLISKNTTESDYSKPYPFFLAHPLPSIEELKNTNEWQAEWKWDGIRGQIIKRNNQLYVWSRGEELMTDKFPEFSVLIDKIENGVVIDGEIICLQPNTESNSILPLPFSVLQTRIGRKNISKKQLNAAPVGFVAYDLLEFNHNDIRMQPLFRRRNLLEKIVLDIAEPNFHLSPEIVFNNWGDLQNKRLMARENGSEGLMIKRKDSLYETGRKKGSWWKWKIDPLTIDAVLVYAQKGAGRRSNLYTDYTFAVKNGYELVTFTKAYSGLTDKEIKEVDAFVKKHAIEKFGPVRTVKPELVFEIAFEGIAESKRHKSGVALRFPRMNRWRKDKKADEINTIDDLRALLKMYGTEKKQD